MEVPDWIGSTILRLSKVAPRIEMLNAKLISLRAALESRTDAKVKGPFDTLQMIVIYKQSFILKY